MYKRKKEGSDNGSKNDTDIIDRVEEGQ